MRCGGQENPHNGDSEERERNVEGCRLWARRRVTHRQPRQRYGPASSHVTLWMGQMGIRGVRPPLRMVQHHVIQRQKPTCRAIVANYTHGSIQKGPLPTTQPKFDLQRIGNTCRFSRISQSTTITQVHTGFGLCFAHLTSHNMFSPSRLLKVGPSNGVCSTAILWMIRQNGLFTERIVAGNLGRCVLY
jgi:hypothetical protein